MKTMITTLMMAVSINATAAEPIGAILENNQATTQLYLTCETMQPNGCTKESIVYLTKDTVKAREIVDKLHGMIGASSKHSYSDLIVSEKMEYNINYTEIQVPSDLVLQNIVKKMTIDPISKKYLMIVSTFAALQMPIPGVVIATAVDKFEDVQLTKKVNQIKNTELKGSIIKTRMFDQFSN